MMRPDPPGEEPRRAAAARLSEDASGVLRRLDHLSEARHVVTEASRRGVEVLLLKGPALAAIAYGAPDARDYLDVDLLVRPGGLAPLREILEERGFRCSREIPPHLTENIAAYAPLLATEFVFNFPGKKLFVDVHLALAHADMAPVLDDARAWERAETVDLVGVPVRTLGPVDTVVYLALHGMKHAWCSSYLVDDFARYAAARATAEVWCQVMEEARARGCLRLVLVAVALARLRSGAEFPAAVLEALGRDDRARGVAEALHRELDTREKERRGLRATLMRRHAWDTPGGRIRWLGRLLFTPNLNDLAFVRLPPRLSSLYLVVRPVRLAWSWVVRGRR
ncbi:MAG: nucleotidyltransferase family protein [Deltaproteobacteria bacterium]|nr:nucleotidyltransferase family protein [Deltaproteobacteria bacterium]